MSEPAPVPTCLCVDYPTVVTRGTCVLSLTGMPTRSAGRAAGRSVRKYRDTQRRGYCDRCHVRSLCALWVARSHRLSLVHSRIVRFLALRADSRHPVVGTSGIAVKNETEVPLLVVCSQLTPLHWGKGARVPEFSPVLSDRTVRDTRSAPGPTLAFRPPPAVPPGATWNEHNELGMGKVSTV